MKIEKMAQESRVQQAMEEQERRFGRITRSISGELPWQGAAGNRSPMGTDTLALA